MADEGHTHFGSFFSDNFAGCALGAHQQDFVVVSRQLFGEIKGFIKSGNGLFEVDDVDFS